MNKEWLFRGVRAIFLAVLIVLSVIAVYYIGKYTYPFIIAIGLAYILNPIVNFLEKRTRLPRGLAVFVSLILIVSAFAGLITLLIAEIVNGAEYLSNVLPTHIDSFVTYIEDFVAMQIIPIYEQLSVMFNSLDTGQQDSIMDSIQNTGTAIATSMTDFIQRFFQALPNAVLWIPNTATVLVFIFLATFFISKDWERLLEKTIHILPIKAQSHSRTIVQDLKKALFGFIQAQLTLITFTTLIVLIGLLILRVEYAITIALVAGLVDLLPYLGTAAVIIPWMIYEFLTGDIRLGIGLAILYGVVTIQRQLMEPKVLSSSIGIDPLATLVALFVGFKLVGFLGLILGPVTLVLITALQKAGVFRDIWKFIKGQPTT
ncbi:membrane protein [Bacillus coahuilensis m2-6]|uniref:sporulation integral membrane protein YtvI n=1 Tax=Bacillus coahuilensis TaxID=408580 RepID=UPI00018511BE|nr:sporulation integral membrane protein YtvI [Bacillus coahuilensis]KUP06656.1 membrane protein [Bacillus coahuilensis m2-6]